MKLATKIYCLEIQGTGHLISKKYKGLKWMFQWNFQLAPILPESFTSVP
jgi:hypothetical protein